MFLDEIIPETPEQQARRTMEGFGMAKEFDNWLAGGGGRQPGADPGYAPATPMPGGMGMQMPQQSLLSPEQSSDVGFAMKSPREQAAEMIGRMGGRDQTAEFNAYMDRPKTAAAEDIRRLAGDGAAASFLSKPQSYYEMNVKQSPEYFGLGAGLPASYTPDVMNSVAEDTTANMATQPPMPQPMPQQPYQPYSASMAPASPAAIQSQMQREDTALGNQFVGPPAPPAAQSPLDAIIGQQGGQYINDGFHAGNPAAQPASFSSQFRADPFMATDSFMANGPIQTLGVNGFRTGASRPAYDDWGIRQRDAIARHNVGLTSILGNQENERRRNAMDVERMGLMHQDRQDAVNARRQAEFDRNFQHLPAGKRGDAIADAARGKLISPEAAANMLNRDLMDAASITAGGISKETGKPKNTQLFMRGLAANFDPKRHSKADVIRAIEGMGITADEIAQYENDPTIGPFAKSILGPMVQYKTSGLQTIIEDAKRVPEGLSRYIYR